MKKIIVPALLSGILLLIIFWFLAPKLIELTYSPMLKNKEIRLSSSVVGWEMKKRIVVCLSVLTVPILSIALLVLLQKFKHISISIQKFLKFQVIIALAFCSGIFVKVFLFYKFAESIAANPYPISKEIRPAFDISRIVIQDTAIMLSSIAGVIIYFASRRMKVEKNNSFI